MKLFWEAGYQLVYRSFYNCFCAAQQPGSLPITSPCASPSTPHVQAPYCRCCSVRDERLEAQLRHLGGTSGRRQAAGGKQETKQQGTKQRAGVPC